jgi:hypothetical protein
MKRVYLISVLVILSAMCFAQETIADSSRQFRHDIGLNAIGMFRALFNSDEVDAITPYLISYNLDMGKTNFRVGIGPAFSSSTETHEGFSDSQKNTTVNLDVRVGLGFDIVDHQKWTVRTGFDVIGGYHIDKTVDDTGFDKVTHEDEEWNLGAGPFVQLVFRINDRISLSTDAALYFKHFNRTENELFENFPDFNNELSKTTGQKLEVFLPTSLFIHFHF